MRVVTPGASATPIRPLPYNYCCVGRGQRDGQTGVGGVGECVVEQVLGNVRGMSRFLNCDFYFKLVGHKSVFHPRNARRTAPLTGDYPAISHY